MTDRSASSDANASGGWLPRARGALFQPVSIASLVFFRIAFGLTLLFEVLRYFYLDWIPRYFIEPQFYFKYYGFEWVQPWPGNGMYWHFALMGIAAAMMTLGWYYRIASVAFLVLFSYVFLLDQALYLNHFYFVILLGALLCVTPAHKAFSIDALRKPSLASSTVPAWAVLILVMQMEVMYLYAGIVKVNPDWLQLQPLTMWLGSRTDLALVGPWLDQTWAVALASYGSIALHLIGAPLLLWRKTRLAVFCIYALFHTSNHFMFEIGIFPWLTLLGTTIFFDPDWPLQLRDRYRAWRGCKPLPRPVLQTSVYPSVSWVMPFVVAWMAVQILLPLRHLLYPGSPSWTEEGHRFAWQMKLRSKAGHIRFDVVDPATGKRQRIDPLEVLTERQRTKMSCRPDMILQYAHFLAEQRTASTDGARPQVYARAYCSLNGRRPQWLIDRKVDLAAVPRNLAHANWILPLTEPLRRPDEHAAAR